MGAQNWFDYYFGPVDKASCNWFLAYASVALITLFMFWGMLFSGLVITGGIRLTLEMAMMAFMTTITMFMAYLTQRLLYQTCMR